MLPIRPVLSLAPVLLILATMPSALALITGGDDDRPLDVPDWPAGAAEIFNIRQRVAYWEGPPFGGGQHHGEYRGDTATLNQVLAGFAKIENANKRIVVEDGVGRSFWLNPNNEPNKREKAQIDWRLMVWSRSSFEQLTDLPASINPTDPNDRQQGPPTELTIWTGGNIDWDKVQLPAGVEVVDKRLEAHGYSADDGCVAEGVLRDVVAGAPLSGSVQLQDIGTQLPADRKGQVTLEVAAGKDGKWVVKDVPDGWYRLVAVSEGYLPRIVGYVRPDGQPRWQQFASQLAKGGTVAGSVTDADGNPLDGVNVRLTDTSPADGSRYDSPERYETTTDAKGQFQFVAPVGTASIRLHKPGWCRPGLGPDVTVPSEHVELQMVRSSNITVIVLFQGTEVPEEYMVELEPEAGSTVGKWSGSAHIDQHNQFAFENVPPDRYRLWGHPNPFSEREKSEPILLDLKGGETIVKTIVVAE